MINKKLHQYRIDPNAYQKDLFKKIFTFLIILVLTTVASSDFIHQRVNVEGKLVKTKDRVYHKSNAQELELRKVKATIISYQFNHKEFIKTASNIPIKEDSLYTLRVYKRFPMISSVEGVPSMDIMTFWFLIYGISIFPLAYYIVSYINEKRLQKTFTKKTV